jgi:Predicted restriction endonuclease
MPPDRLRSIVPMFGGGTQYVETLDDILTFVDTHAPTTDELVGWHRGTFQNVSSQESILRRVRYLRDVGFLRNDDDNWHLGDLGEEYLTQQDTTTLLRIMCGRNVGLRSLLYALSAAPMTLAEISSQQLDTHPELGWSPEQTDMAKQRVNWLRSMGLIEQTDDQYDLTGEGKQFVTDAVEQWAGTHDPTPEADYQAGTYEATTHARVVDPEFRATILTQHDHKCPISGVDHPGLLDVAHVLSWSDHPEHRADMANVLPLSKTHHAAFDRELFTLDGEYHLRVNPEFDTDSQLLQRTIIERAGEQIQLDDSGVDPAYLTQHNADLAWV